MKKQMGISGITFEAVKIMSKYWTLIQLPEKKTMLGVWSLEAPKSPTDSIYNVNIWINRCWILFQCKETELCAKWVDLLFDIPFSPYFVPFSIQFILSKCWLFNTCIVEARFLCETICQTFWALRVPYSFCNFRSNCELAWQAEMWSSFWSN